MLQRHFSQITVAVAITAKQLLLKYRQLPTTLIML
jgi:hypothetical protein